MADDEGIDPEIQVAGEPGRKGAGGFAAGVVVGALLGAGIALLFAPDRGDRTRRRLSRRLEALREARGGRRARRLRARLQRALG